MPRFINHEFHRINVLSCDELNVDVDSLLISLYIRQRAPLDLHDYVWIPFSRDPSGVDKLVKDDPKSMNVGSLTMLPSRTNTEDHIIPQRSLHKAMAHNLYLCSMRILICHEEKQRLASGNLKKDGTSQCITRYHTNPIGVGPYYIWAYGLFTLYGPRRFQL